MYVVDVLLSVFLEIIYLSDDKQNIQVLDLDNEIQLNDLTLIYTRWWGMTMYCDQ